jgi:phospholipase/lecithinase/hemolysin
MVSKRDVLLTGLGAGALASGALPGAGAEAADAGRSPFTSLVVIGDSLSDMGNGGRYSDGPVWVERVAERLGLALRPSRAGGANHAVGGARVRGGPDDLRSQGNVYLGKVRRGGGRPDPGALHLVWGGANDVLGAGFAPDRDRAVVEAATAVGTIVGDLADAGATRVLALNLPDVGHTPALRAGGPVLAAEGRRLTQAFNAALAPALDRVERRHPTLRLTRLDVFAMAERVFADPAAAGFRDAANPCQGRGGSCEGVLFWDQIHPTSYAHARLAAAALEALGVPAAG